MTVPAHLPDYWTWKAGGTVVDVRQKRRNKHTGKMEPTEYSVDALVANRSQLVANGLSTVTEWLHDSRAGWVRFHPDDEQHL